jgi:hypothetical protein
MQSVTPHAKNAKNGLEYLTTYSRDHYDANTHVGKSWNDDQINYESNKPIGLLLEDEEEEDLYKYEKRRPTIMKLMLVKTPRI